MTRTRAHKHWNDEERQYILFNGATKSLERLAEDLQRSQNAVRQQAQKLDWPGYLQLAEVAKQLGVYPSLANAWMHRDQIFGRLIKLPGQKGKVIPAWRITAMLWDPYFAWLASRHCNPPDEKLARYQAHTWSIRLKWYVPCSWLAEECTVQTGTVQNWIYREQLPAVHAPLGRPGPTGYLIARGVAETWIDEYTTHQSPRRAAVQATQKSRELTGFDKELKVPWRSGYLSANAQAGQHGELL